MDVITIESKAYKELVSKINNIAGYIAKHLPNNTANLDDEWVDSYDVCTFLKISERTLQRLRTNGQVLLPIRRHTVGRGGRHRRPCTLQRFLVSCLLPHMRISQKTYYLESNVLKFLREHLKKPDWK